MSEPNSPEASSIPAEEVVLPVEGSGEPALTGDEPRLAGELITGKHAERCSGYRVQVGEFDGPLDLLLHLVRANEVEISDIPIVTITKQYNEQLDLMREYNLEVAGEYLVMAGTLMYIKSRMLLPPDPEAQDDEGEDDPRRELVQQLYEYQRFKQAAETLQAMDSRRNLIWTRDEVLADFEGEELLAVDLFDLLKAFKGLLGRLGDEAKLQLRREQVSVADKIHWLGELLETRKSIEFSSLLEDLQTPIERIATFLAILEMMKLQMIVAFQRKAHGEIRIARKSDTPIDTDLGKLGYEDEGGTLDETLDAMAAEQQALGADEPDDDNNDENRGVEASANDSVASLVAPEAPELDDEDAKNAGIEDVKDE